MSDFTKKKTLNSQNTQFRVNARYRLISDYPVVLTARRSRAHPSQPKFKRRAVVCLLMKLPHHPSYLLKNVNAIMIVSLCTFNCDWLKKPDSFKTFNSSTLSEITVQNFFPDLHIELVIESFTIFQRPV